MSNTTQDIHKQIIFISSLFLLYLVISSNPFEYFEAKSNDMGLGLNPILQNILFVIFNYMNTCVYTMLFTMLFQVSSLYSLNAYYNITNNGSSVYKPCRLVSIDEV